MNGSDTPPVRVQRALREADSDDQTAVPEGSGRTRRDRTGKGATAKGGPDVASRHDPFGSFDEPPVRRRPQPTDDTEMAQTSPGPPSRRDLELLVDDDRPARRVDVDQFSRDTDISDIRAALFDEGAPRQTGPRHVVRPPDDPGFEPDPEDDLEEEQLPDELKSLLDAYVREPAAPAAGVVRARVPRAERTTASLPAAESAPEAPKRGIVLESLPVSGENAAQAARRLKQEAWRRRARRLANEE
jgi:hypothetical protein